MNEANARQTIRIGGLCFAVAATFACISIGAIDPVMVAVIAGVVALGVALMFRWRAARWLAALGFAGVIAATLWQVARVAMALDLADTPPSMLANALASATLFVWLPLCAIRVLLDRPPPTRLVTPRIAGAVIVVAMATNIALLPAGVSGGLSLAFSSTGTTVWGFVGWQIVDGVLALAALGLLLGPRRIARHASTIVLIGAIAIPLIALDTGEHVLGSLDVLAIEIVPIYLAWWLRASLA
jgi:hypothetical protein